jgi:hypothetical protein
VTYKTKHVADKQFLNYSVSYKRTLGARIGTEKYLRHHIAGEHFYAKNVRFFFLKKFVSIVSTHISVHTKK